MHIIFSHFLHFTKFEMQLLHTNLLHILHLIFSKSNEHFEQYFLSHNPHFLEQYKHIFLLHFSH